MAKLTAIPHELLTVIVLAVVLGACGQAALAQGAVAIPSPAVDISSLAPVNVAPTAPPDAIPRKLNPVATPMWLSADAAYLRQRGDGTADLWVRFNTRTESAVGFADIYVTLLSASGPIGSPIPASSVYTLGLALPRAHDWLNVTLSMSDAVFASVTGVRLTDAVPPIKTVLGRASYSVSNVAAVRKPDGSITVSGTLDWILSGPDANGGLAAALAFVVLDRAGAPLGGFGASIAPPGNGTSAFHHSHFSANSSADTASSLDAAWMLPGTIATVEVFTLLNH
jgi:hypothetical protein